MKEVCDGSSKNRDMFMLNLFQELDDRLEVSECGNTEVGEAGHDEGTFENVEPLLKCDI